LDKRARLSTRAGCPSSSEAKIFRIMATIG
jgi:hypothetical protein